MNIPKDKISSREFSNIFMSHPELISINTPDWPRPLYKLPKQTIIEINYDGAEPPLFLGAVPEGEYTVIDYDKYEIIQEGIFGLPPTIIYGTPRFYLKDQNNNKTTLLANDLEKLRIKKLNGKTWAWEKARTKYVAGPIAEHIQEKAVKRRYGPGGPGRQKDFRKYAEETGEEVDELLLASETPINRDDYKYDASAGRSSLSRRKSSSSRRKSSSSRRKSSSSRRKSSLSKKGGLSRRKSKKSKKQTKTRK
tara:strand:- start:50 stop:802 length:753 start_codon:yes stop_codon:yes gene_type:complete